MTPAAETIWSALEFRTPMLLRNVEPLGDAQMRWQPAPGSNSIAWQLWHIAEVEDNWIRSLVTGEPLRFPFGVQVRFADTPTVGSSSGSGLVEAEGRFRARHTSL